MIKEVTEFLRYAIDPGKVKKSTLLVQSVALLMLVGCRSQLIRDNDKFEARTAELVAAHEAEVQMLTTRAERGIYATLYLSSNSFCSASESVVTFPYRLSNSSDSSLDNFFAASYR